MLTPLAAYENNYLCRTDPKDVARVESKTWIVTPDKYQVSYYSVSKSFRSYLNVQENNNPYL